MNADDEVKGKMRAKNVALYDCIIKKKAHSWSSSHTKKWFLFFYDDEVSFPVSAQICQP